jgi:hypothetical protein
MVIISYNLRKYTLQERLHDGGRVWKDGLDDLCLLTDDHQDLIK